MSPLQFLHDPSFDAKIAGKKASSLHELVKLKQEVPPGFVVPASLENELSLSQSVNRNFILQALKQIGGYPVAVRSSSNLEDLSDASFAGLYETYLNIKNDDELFKAIADCFESGRGTRVQAYLKNKKLLNQHLEVSVLIQKMVNAQTSGVLFTIHPTLGKEEEAYVEACHGFGEKLVSGQIQPSRYRLKLEDGRILESEIGPEGDLIQSNLARALCQRGLEIMSHFGRPQDIEWATDSTGKLWLLQSRPITTLIWRNDVEEYTNADFKDGGVSASVCTPLMYTLYEAAMQTSMQAYMQAIKLLRKNAPQKIWIKSYYGRAYWNASEVKRQMFRVPGFDELAFDLDLGIQKNYGSKGPVRVPTNLWTILPVIPVALAVEKEYKDQLIRTENYQRLVYLPKEQALYSKLHSTRDASFFDLAREILEFQLKTEQDYFTTIYGNTNLQGDFKKFVRDQAEKYQFEFDLAKLFSGIDQISHLEAQSALLNLVSTADAQGITSQNYLNERQTFLKDFGFHADRELDLLCPRWHEVPNALDTRVSDLLKSKARLVNPAISQVSQREEYEKEKNRIIALLPKNSLKQKFSSFLERVRLYIRRREEMREVSTKAYDLTRALTLKFGACLAEMKILNEAADLFFVTRTEIMNLKESISKNEIQSLRDRVAYRKQIYEGYRNLTPPNELGFGTTAIEAGVWSSDANGSMSLKGLGCSPGTVRGTVRVVQTLDEAYQLQEGEILVTRFTDPGWTAVLGMVKGVVTEVGGMLSHAAVIGRELGVPAILNLPQATSLLKNGDQIEMNGSTGEIRIVT